MIQPSGNILRTVILITGQSSRSRISAYLLHFIDDTSSILRRGSDFGIFTLIANYIYHEQYIHLFWNYTYINSLKQNYSSSENWRYEDGKRKQGCRLNAIYQSRRSIVVFIRTPYYASCVTHVTRLRRVGVERFYCRLRRSSLVAQIISDQDGKVYFEFVHLFVNRREAYSRLSPDLMHRYISRSTNG